MNTAITRTSLPKVTGTGRRNGLYLLLTSVNTEVANAWALEGSPVWPDQDVDLPTGAILARRTPTGSSRNGGWAWSYATVPEPKGEWSWSEPMPDTKFIQFRDLVANKLFDQVQVPHSVDPRRFTDPGPPPSTPTPIGDAVQLWNHLDTVTKDPGLRFLTYNRSQGGFIHEGDIPQDKQKLLREASAFMHRIIHAAPSYLKDAFCWENHTLKITADPTTLVKAYYGLDPNQLSHVIMPQEGDEPPPDPTLRDAVLAALAEATAVTPSLLKQAWLYTEHRLTPLGFALERTNHPNTVHLTPRPQVERTTDSTPEHASEDGPFTSKGHVLFPVNDPKYAHTPHHGMSVTLTVPVHREHRESSRWTPLTMEPADHILVHDISTNPPPTGLNRQEPDGEPSPPEQQPQIKYLALVTIGTTNWAGRNNDTQEYWHCTADNLTPLAKALHSTLKTLYPEAEPQLQTWLKP